PEIDATTAHQPRSPVPRANKPISARTLQPRLNVKPQQAFATIPIAPHLRGFVQSGFYEVALTTHAPGPFSHATSQNPQDSQITFSVTHGWSVFWRGRPWLAGRRIGETSSDVGSSRFWIGWVTTHGDKCARSTCRD